METLRRLARHVLLALASGYVLFFYSERLFFAAFRPGDSLADYAIAWLAYSAAGYLLLAIVRGLRVRGWAGVLVAGGIFGWIVEGVWAPTLYGTEPSAPFPLSILITAIQWHALITVLLGWYALPRLLRRDRRGWTLATAVGIGLAWGAWAPFQWGETPPVIMTPAGFAAYAAGTWGLLVAAYWALDRLRFCDFRPARAAVWVILALHAAVFVALDLLPLGVRTLLILPPLLAVGLGLLWIARGGEESALETFAAPVAPRQYLALLITPLAATAAYVLALAAGEKWPPLQMLLWIGAAGAGAALWLWAAAHLVRIRQERLVHGNHGGNG